MPKKGERKPESELSQSYSARRMRVLREKRRLENEQKIYKRIVLILNTIMRNGKKSKKRSPTIVQTLRMKNYKRKSKKKRKLNKTTLTSTLITMKITILMYLLNCLTLTMFLTKI